jgi:hypothetical protein
MPNDGRSKILRETLFGDLPLSAWADGKKGEPWEAFGAAQRSIEQGNRKEAGRLLRSITEREGLESRHYLEAWTALRQLGLTPAAADAKHVYGVIVDVPIETGFDTLAAYEDRSARYLNFSGAAIVWDAPDARMDDRVRDLLLAGQELAPLIGPWDQARPPLAAGRARISLLTPGGFHFGEGPFEALAQDAKAARLIATAAALMRSLIEVAEQTRGTT